MTLDDLLANCRQFLAQRMKSPFILQQCDSIVCPRFLVVKLKLSHTFLYPATPFPFVIDITTQPTSYTSILV